MVVGRRRTTFHPFGRYHFQPIATPGDSDRVSFSALQAWYARIDGYGIPEAEWRQLRDSTSDGRVARNRDFPGSQDLMTILSDAKKFGDLAVPALAIFALPHVVEAFITDSTDPSVREVAKAYLTTVDSLVERQARAFEAGVPRARVIRLRGHHYIFITNEAEVLREIRAFLAGLK